MHVNLENLADAQSIADNLALLPKEALLYGESSWMPLRVPM